MKRTIGYRVIVALLVIFINQLNMTGQDDPRAQKIIDDMSAKFKSYAGASVDFSYTIIQKQNDSKTERQDGKIWVKNNKYKLSIADFVIYFDGSKIYQYLPSVNEVNISKPEADDNSGDFQLFNPQSYFNISAKSFRIPYVKEGTENNRSVYEIDLYPLQIRGTKYLRIRIKVDRTSLQLASMQVFMKDGTDYILNFKPYNILTALDDSFFRFNKNEHPNVEVIDLTF